MHTDYLLRRITNPILIDKPEVLKHISEFNTAEFTIQFSEKIYSKKILNDINELCNECNDKLTIRFYSHDKEKFDARVLNQISNVKSLCLDYMDSVNNISELKNLSQLKKLRLGIDKLNEPLLLNYKNLSEIIDLSLVFRLSKDMTLNITPLAEYSKLSVLRLYGEPKNLNIVGKIDSLKELDLWNISKHSSLEFVNNLPQLNSLSLTFGGRANLFDINNNCIKKIYLDQVRGFNSISNIETFTSLEQLILRDLPQLSTIEFPNNLQNFKKLVLSNCKMLYRISGIERLTSLETLNVHKLNIDFTEFMKNKFPKSLKLFVFSTDKVRRDKEIYEHLKQLGYNSRF
jgi:hypothetical protein